MNSLKQSTSINSCSTSLPNITYQSKISWPGYFFPTLCDFYSSQWFLSGLEGFKLDMNNQSNFLIGPSVRVLTLLWDCESREPGLNCKSVELAVSEFSLCYILSLSLKKLLTCKQILYCFIISDIAFCILLSGHNYSLVPKLHC